MAVETRQLRVLVGRMLKGWGAVRGINSGALQDRQLLKSKDFGDK
jgi:hypothetical protein